jgi:hypothetical protein
MHSMGVIRISDAAEKFLYENSRMGDTFDTVLRRLHPDIAQYDAAGKPQDGRSPTALIKKRAKKGTVAPAGTFKPYILKVLLAAPGYKLRIGDVIRAVETLVKPKLSAVDYERLASGGVVRWENRCQWDRAEMVNDKLLEPPAISGRGNWMLSAKGVAEAKKLP